MLNVFWGSRSLSDVKFRKNKTFLVYFFRKQKPERAETLLSAVLAQTDASLRTYRPHMRAAADIRPAGKRGSDTRQTSSSERNQNRILRRSEETRRSCLWHPRPPDRATRSRSPQPAVTVMTRSGTAGRLESLQRNQNVSKVAIKHYYYFLIFNLTLKIVKK